MKCHCYEPDSAFVFCVEDVENAQLEDVIKHMAWKKSTANSLFQSMALSLQTAE